MILLCVHVYLFLVYGLVQVPDLFELPLFELELGQLNLLLEFLLVDLIEWLCLYNLFHTQLGVLPELPPLLLLFLQASELFLFLLSFLLFLPPLIFFSLSHCLFKFLFLLLLLLFLLCKPALLPLFLLLC